MSDTPKPPDRQHVADASQTPSVANDRGRIRDEGINPQNVSSMSRAEDDAAAWQGSPEFHDTRTPNTRAVAKDDWRAFFDAISRQLLGKHAEIETASLDLGGQVVAEWLPMIGITYESQNDMLSIGLVGLNHLIRNPREIHVQENRAGIEGIVVVGSDGVQQIIKLKDPLLLTV